MQTTTQPKQEYSKIINRIYFNRDETDEGILPISERRVMTMNDLLELVENDQCISYKKAMQQ
ncbi:hypothetical protein [Spirochaeta africana]|uniref:Uncharacterized protein n=1 Tax=Spirochaeta africana (strain ATCC 700263 / DSM 8902 / Z-7692) TaxID=889378 RepID=H9UIU8_SPIAZ|nr:hypothetical protein [Spirochaeta africana]AFG37441.1 hypothetical protein Spiaf_1375 [Spirochaeta africana DSM 8902]